MGNPRDQADFWAISINTHIVIHLHINTLSVVLGTFSVRGHHHSICIQYTITHTQPWPRNYAGKKQNEAKTTLEGQKCSNWCQHQRNYGPMKYLQPS